MSLGGQSQVRAGRFAEGKRGYLEDVAKFAKRQEEGNKRKKNMMVMDKEGIHLEFSRKIQILSVGKFVK